MAYGCFISVFLHVFLLSPLSWKPVLFYKCWLPEMLAEEVVSVDGSITIGMGWIVIEVVIQAVNMELDSLSK